MTLLPFWKPQALIAFTLSLTIPMGGMNGFPLTRRSIFGS